MVGPQLTNIRAFRPTSGHLDPTALKKRREADKYISVSAELQRRSQPSAKVTPQRLALLVAEIRRFLDEHFGVDSDRDDDKDRGITIFPARLFTDFAENGAITCMLEAIFRFADQNDFDPDFSERGDVQKSYDALRFAEKVLREKNFLRTVKAFLSPKISEGESKELLEALLRHGAAILSTPHVATHIIYPDPPGTRENQTDDQVLCRMLAVATFDNQEQCFVHWLHNPDSYDDWVPRNEVLGVVNTPPKRSISDQWHLSARWVRDSDMYNEWMNELDYEMPDDFNDYIGRPPTDPKEARLISKYSRVRLRLRQPVEEKSPEEHDNFGMIGLPTIGTEEGNTQLNGDESAAEGADSDVEEELLVAGQFRAPDADDTDERGEPSGGNEKVPIGDGLYMPAFATWFDLDAVHDIERRALPEFFSEKFASKNEATYREIRNFMIRSWRRSKAYLTGTAARRHLSGDACAILRVHGFLEHWGLINYGCDDTAQGSFNSPPKTLPVNAGTENEGSGRKSILLLDNGTKAEKKRSKVLKRDWNGEPISDADSSNFLIREFERTGHSQIADVQDREPIEYHCDSCGVDCSKLRFHCATKADVDLCASCYKNGRYASTMKHRDFIQMTSAGQFGGPEAVDPDLWTESETLLLLEALEMYADNWQLVSEHVGSKNKNQCVTHFLRLPIEDSFLCGTRKRWWGEHPFNDEDLPSPTEIMRTAGARESSVVAATAKGPTAKTYSGQPLVFGDQISTIVPFVSGLLHQASTHTLREVTSTMDFDGPKRRVQNPFRTITKNRSAPAADQPDGSLGEKDDSDVTMHSVDVPYEQMMSDDVYRKLVQTVERPAKVLDSPYGRAISKAVWEDLKRGKMEPQDLSILKFETACYNIYNTKTRGSKFTNGNGQPAHDAGKNETAAKASETAIATSALTAACVTAAQKCLIEEVELDRLLSIVLEIRLEFIRRKIKHLQELTRHFMFSEGFENRKRMEKVSGTVRKKIRRLESGEFARPREVIKSVDVEGLVSTLSIKELDGKVEKANARTEQGWVQMERQKTSLPNFGTAFPRAHPNDESDAQQPTKQFVGPKDSENDVNMTDQPDN